MAYEKSVNAIADLFGNMFGGGRNINPLDAYKAQLMGQQSVGYGWDNKNKQLKYDSDYYRFDNLKNLGSDSTISDILKAGENPAQYWDATAKRDRHNIALDAVNSTTDYNAKLNYMDGKTEYKPIEGTPYFSNPATGAYKYSGSSAPPKPQRGFNVADFLARTAKMESNNNPGAVSPTGATGLLQFTKGTGRQYGLVGDGYDYRTDPNRSIQAGKALTNSNIKYLQAAGIPITGANVYLAHQQGAVGAKQIIQAAMSGREVSPEIRRNMDLNGGKGLTPAQFVNKYEQIYSGAPTTQFGKAIVPLNQQGQPITNIGMAGMPQTNTIFGVNIPQQPLMSQKEITDPLNDLNPGMRIPTIEEAFQERENRKERAKTMFGTQPQLKAPKVISGSDGQMWVQSANGWEAVGIPGYQARPSRPLVEFSYPTSSTKKKIDENYETFLEQEDDRLDGDATDFSTDLMEEKFKHDLSVLYQKLRKENPYLTDEEIMQTAFDALKGGLTPNQTNWIDDQTDYATPQGIFSGVVPQSIIGNQPNIPETINIQGHTVTRQQILDTAQNRGLTPEQVIQKLNEAQ